MTDPDAIVIGAGVAGLAAAGRLARAGVRVRVIEARERTGGRIFTEQPEGWRGPVELGAEFIHSGNAALDRLFAEAGLRKRPIEERHWLIREGKRERRDDVWERIDATLRKIGPRFAGSFANWLSLRGGQLAVEERELAVGFVKGFQAARLEEMSAATLHEATKHEEEQFRPATGYAAVVAALQARVVEHGATIELGSPVTRIAWGRGAVRVSAGRRHWRARAVVVTVPPGVLGVRDGLRFEPPLKAKGRLWRSAGIGHVRRVVFRLRADAWKRGPIPGDLRTRDGRGFGFLHSNEELFPVWWAEPPHPVLVGWTGGEAAEAMRGWSEARVVRAALRTLGKLLDRDPASLAKVVVAARTHDWSADPFSRGGYGFSVAGRERLPKQLGAPVGGTLFFAGEATADALELGTVHGALASGERAAREVLSMPRFSGRRGR